MFVVNEQRCRVDLHTHTNASDGYLSPEQLVIRATEQKLSMLAITDHDTTAAIQEARTTIAVRNLPLTLISGVEISTCWENHEIHIVGLNFNENQPELQHLLAKQSERRLERAKIIGERLEKAGITMPLAGAQRLAGNAMLTRAHFARYLIECGKASTMAGVFKQYLARGKIGYVPPQWCTISDAISAIHGAGGFAVVAHPARYKLSNKWLKRLLNDFAICGGDGMEVAQCQQSPDERRKLTEYAREFNLLSSQGSDFHQPIPWCELGKNLWLPKEAQPIWKKFTDVIQPVLAGNEDL